MEDQNSLYREILLEHWRNPNNYGTAHNPNFKVSGDNPLCGDSICITGTISKGMIVDVHFTAQACVICTAYTSMLVDRVEALNRKELIDLFSDELSYLDIVALPLGRRDCALLSWRLLKTIIAD